jgi:hypothetical protein
MNLSKIHTQNLQAHPITQETLSKFKAASQNSLAAQVQIDATEQAPFEDFVADYFA